MLAKAQHEPNVMVVGHEVAYKLGVRRVLCEEDGKYYVWNEADKAFTTPEGE